MTDHFGVYVHIPFCSRRCDYCAFATFTDRDHLQGTYLEALRRDIERADLPPATSVFVGGGTPTAVDAAALADVLRVIRRAPGAEVTVECNPDDVTDDLAAHYASAGVDRVSIGVQSMVPHVLASLGRHHTPTNVGTAVRAMRDAGIRRINLDLIYGAVGESLHDWRSTLEQALLLEPSHVSAYALTVEGGTPLAAQPERHPDDDDLADKYEMADELLERAGLSNYEVSNWAMPGEECRHNVLYWQQGDYAGFGSAAHSHRAGRRWWNVRTPERYIDAVELGLSAESSGESLDDDTRRIEGLQLALRMRDGVPAAAFEDGDLAELAPLVVVEDGRVRLTRGGRLLANEVAIRLR
ncbi:MAG: radical SAM family heme chaperone HemW [Ilumatobacteraceae bacterium]